MQSLQRIAAALLTLVLVGCGGSGSDDAGGDKADAPTPNAAAANGDTIMTDAFSYTVPSGWKKSDAGSTGALSLVVNLDDKDGFSDNINVVKDDTIVGVGGDRLEDAVKNVLESVKATDITIKDRIRIDGDEAVHAGAIFEQKGTKYRTEQYAVSHGKAGYVVTVSFSESVPDAERDEVSESILTTWKWAS